MDHKGEVISYSLIKDQMTNVHSWNNIELQAMLVWQDCKNFITELSVLPSSNVLQFKVGASTPANAVIALQGRQSTTGDWETLWTWHIWMTDEASATVDLEN